MAKVTKCFLVLFFLGLGLNFFSPEVCANNLSITNVSLEERNQTDDTVVVEFDLSWYNSWRTDEGYDAAWIFLKACQGSGCSTEYVHAMLNTAGVSPVDTSAGSNEALKINVPSDKVGALIYRTGNGTGNISSTDVRLTVDYATSPMSSIDTTSITIRVYGIEMVGVPTGSYYLGDGNGTNESSNAFHDAAGSTTTVQITTALKSDIHVDSNSNDDNQLDSIPYGIGIDGDGGLDTDDNGAVDNASFPTGYQAFYVMKYEMTQGQYRDFLNTLDQTKQSKRVHTTTAARITGESAYGYFVMTDTTAISYRNTIKAGSNPAAGMPYTFGCDYDDDETLNENNDGEWIAMNNLRWMDAAAYADWAGLRPMTELEYEKAARGVASSVYAQYAWATSTSLTQATGTASYTPSNSGYSSEYSVTSGNGLCNYNGAGTDVWSPMRVGFAATSSTTRLTAGAGYYGIMELSGNLSEMVVSLGDATGRSFAGTHGDGVLTTTASYEGNATNTDWPGIDGTAARGVTGYAGAGLRGGDYTTSTVNDLTISNRTMFGLSSLATSGIGYFGARCARTP